MNHDVASPETGAPLLRSAVTVFIPGNHDLGRPDMVEVPNFDTHQDLLAYFYLWSAPLNGPTVGGDKRTANIQSLKGESARQEAFLQAAAGRYPRMAASASTTPIRTGSASTPISTWTGPTSSCVPGCVTI